MDIQKMLGETGELFGKGLNIPAGISQFGQNLGDLLAPDPQAEEPVVDKKALKQEAMRDKQRIMNAVDPQKALKSILAEKRAENGVDTEGPLGALTSKVSNWFAGMTNHPALAALFGGGPVANQESMTKYIQETIADPDARKQFISIMKKELSEVQELDSEINKENPVLLNPLRMAS